MESPGSVLSDYASDDFPEDVKGRRLSFDSHDRERSGPPKKRQRVTRRATSDPPAAHHPGYDDADLSEDTDGSVPASPTHPSHMIGEDDYGQEQITYCKWEGCEAGDLGNMDRLVDHLHEDHIGLRQKKYACEWSDCNRKGIPHASGYALRAHMRSHTREKPFYCTLPECDRSFTRSDALAKHMRTVHETEALRPSDPVPKHHSSNPSNRFQRLKLVLNKGMGNGPEKSSTPTPASPSSHPPPSATAATNPEYEYVHNNIIYTNDPASPNGPPLVNFPPDIQFTPSELALPAPELFRLLRRQLVWAQQEAEELKAEAEILERKRKDEWIAKELLLENAMEAEVARGLRKEEEAGTEDQERVKKMIIEDVDPSLLLEIEGKTPWWREESLLRKQRDDVAVKPEPSNAYPPDGPKWHEHEDATVAQEGALETPQEAPL
ncbi:uncharacterized protein BDZ99DRAFT_396944 [Mytilinidion resinicola]|uniref:C2H2-type domain-containing protein n=1 Tax=Mytilinidion resinicola TaxID=574789 RepID=A0A6A6Y7H0_9PEZI|nr:uncharacterized protein BDZ99DRAFT_396944 [Mytilinidion resinicola]KAF2804766.1 hypothetical protein BDZ99DRAFT_396944 [Mytilinidion resinicola]